MKTRIFFLLAALAALCPHLLHSYALEGYTWTLNRTVVMHLSLPPRSTPLQDGFNSFDDSAEDALRIWNQSLGHLQFAVDRHSLLPPAKSDSNTSVSFSNTVYGDTFGNRVLAVTLTTPRRSTLMEADVIFNSALRFDSYRGPSQGSLYDFHRIALHEFGHVLGLDHPDENHPSQSYVAPRPPPVAVMNSIITDVDALQADDIAGAQSLYSAGPAYLFASPSESFVNLSTRGFVGTGDNVFIGGFIIQGSAPATIVLRALGHSLREFGLSDALSDPVIELHNSSGATLAMSDDWIDSPDAQTIASYHLDPPNSRESAIYATLNPGSYTAVVKAYDNHDGDLSGTALVELYDLHARAGRFGNISTRGAVLPEDHVMIGGFIIGGGQTKQVIVRALGPSLADMGTTSVLSDPTVELRDASGNLIASNDNWTDGSDAAAIQAEGFAPSRAAESALQVSLVPGSYTALLRGVGGAQGVGLIEVYDLSPSPN